mgnify:CR=1 FL=1
MEIIVNRETLTKALDTVSGVIASKPAMMILGGILIDAKDSEITLTATDLENTIRVSVSGKVAQKGTVLLPGRKLISLVKQLGEDDVRIVRKDNQVNIQTQNSIYSFFVMDQEEFPKMPKFSGGTTLKMDASSFRSALQNTKFCIYPEEPRPHFRGALLEIKGAQCAFVATDTKRLAVVRRTLGAATSEHVRCLMPYRFLSLAGDILPEDGELEISIGKNQIFLKFNACFVISQLLEGSQDFPDYERVIPDEKKLRTVLFQTAALQSTLRRIALFVTERHNKVKFTFSTQRLTIAVSTPDVGEAQEKMTIEYAGGDQNIAFNPEFLLEFLSRVEGERVLFGFSAETKPVLLRPESDADFLYVAMPLKLD